MGDEFLEEARRNWRAQDAQAIEQVTRRLKRGRRFSDLLLMVESAMGVIAVALAIWMVWYGFARGHAAMMICGVVVLLVAPLCWATYKARVSEPRYDDDTPEGVLRQMIARTEVSMRLMQLARWQGWILVGLAAILWAATVPGWVEATRWLRLATAVWVVSGLAVFGWARWREAGLRRERQRCETLLDEWG